MMLTMDRLKAWVRTWLGITAMASYSKKNHAEVKDGLDHLKKVLISRLNALEDAINRVEKRMIHEHVGGVESFAPPVLDWDTVQAMALHQLEKESQ